MGTKVREDGEQQTQFLYLSTSESEESLSSDLEAEGQQERGEVGRWGEETGLSTLRRDRRVTGQGLKVPNSHWRNAFFFLLRYQAGKKPGMKDQASHTKQLVQKQFG